MARRKIIRIDDALCDGCGQCVTTCAEGALAIVDGKARLVKEQYCDGFGDCIGECPTGALVVEERDAPEFDKEATRAHVAQLGGAEAVRRLEAAAEVHAPATTADGPKQAIPSELRQWPVQLHLVRPDAPFFSGKELVLLNSCGAVASADVHWRFLRGRSVAMGCPKLDDTSTYAAKLAAILKDETIPRVTVVRMEVPCCGGLTHLAAQAATMSGRDDLAVDEVTIGLGGDVFPARTVREGGRPGGGTTN